MPRENLLPIVTELTDDDYFRIIDGFSSKRINKNDVISQVGLPGSTFDQALAGTSTATSLTPYVNSLILPFWDARKKGARPVTTSDQGPAIQEVIDDMVRGTLLITDGDWKVATPLVINASRVQIQLTPGATIYFDDLADVGNLFYFEGAVGTTTTCTGSVVERMSRNIAVTSTAGFVAGDFVQMLSTQDWDITRGTGEYCQSEWNRVVQVVDSTHLKMEKMVAYDWDNTTHPVNVQKIDAVRNGGVSGGTLIGGGTGSLHTAVRFIYSVNSHVRDVNIEYSENVGISFQRCYGATATDNTIMHTDDETTGYGIMSQGSEDVIISNNLGAFNRRSFEANGGENGISRNVLITDNIARNDRTTGCGSHAGTDYVTIARNKMEACGGGVISRGAHGVIEDNDIYNCITSSTGFPISTPYADISYNDAITIGSEGEGVFLAQIGECVAGIAPIVRGNKIHGSNRYAIFMRGCDFVDAKVENNTADGRIMFGQTSGEFFANRCSVSHNDINAVTSTGDPDTFGILVAHKFNDMRMEHNTARGAGTTGIIVIGSTDSGDPNIGLHYEFNKAYDCGTRGHDLATGFYTDSYIIGNYAEDCPTPFRGAPSYAAHVNPIAWGNYSVNPVTVGGFYGWGTSEPSAGTYPVGAIVFNSAPTTGAPLGWRCVTAGTPGTWEAIGQRGFSAINGSTAATITLSALDLNRALMPARLLASSATQGFVIPPIATLGSWPLGEPRSIIVAGTSQLVISGGSGVTVNSKGGALKSNGQGSQIWITYAGSDVWWATGDLTT